MQRSDYAFRKVGWIEDSIVAGIELLSFRVFLRGALLYGRYVPSNHFFATARNTLCNFPFLVSPTRCNNLSSAKKERYTHLSSVGVEHEATRFTKYSLNACSLRSMHNSRDSTCILADKARSCSQSRREKERVT